MDRFDVKNLRQAHQVEALVLLLVQDGQYLMCDVHNLLEELVAEKVVLDEIPTVNVVNQFACKWALLDDRVQDLGLSPQV